MKEDKSGNTSLRKFFFGPPSSTIGKNNSLFFFDSAKDSNYRVPGESPHMLHVHSFLREEPLFQRDTVFQTHHEDWLDHRTM